MKLTFEEWIKLPESIEYAKQQCEKYGWTGWDKYVKDNIEKFDKWR